MLTTTADRYPTRVPVPKPSTPRTDPTVWGSQPGPLDRRTLIRHSTTGYSVHQNLFSADELSSYAAAARGLIDKPLLRHDPRVIREKSSLQVRSIFEPHKLDESIAHLVRDPRLLDRARQILGSEVYVHQCRVNYMPGFTGQGFYWHSDFETWHAEDGMPAPRAVSASIALTENFPYNGSLMVMPGSHRTFVPCVGSTPADNFRQSLREQTIGVPYPGSIAALASECGIDQFIGPAGSVLFFDSNLMHGSGNNITPFPRSNIFIVFNSIENLLVEPFAAPRPRPNFIANRDFRPLTSIDS
ncbi:MAG: ectoine hydroxylase [Nocardiaceae bacterium]|nr:ectoine hydroxylase [Nocardiaceae bacterium]